GDARAATRLRGDSQAATQGLDTVPQVVEIRIRASGIPEDLERERVLALAHSDSCGCRDASARKRVEPALVERHHYFGRVVRGSGDVDRGRDAGTHSSRAEQRSE